MTSRTLQLGGKGKGPLSGARLSGVVMNSKGLKNVENILGENTKAEFMYFRDNEISSFLKEGSLGSVRVLDLSLNQIGPTVDFLLCLPCLHHLYLSINKISSLKGFSGLKSLETLCISENAISSFEGLGHLPNLRVLSLSFNNISTFDQYPSLPNLHTLNLAGNPVSNYSSYRCMAIALNNNSLVSIDGHPVEEEERLAVGHYQGKVVYCIRNGFVIDDEENVEQNASIFVKSCHRTRSLDDNGIVRLTTIRISSVSEPNHQVIQEGKETQLFACMQDVRPLEEAKEDLFSCPYFQPTVFTLKSDGSDVFLMGSFNDWTEPLAMQVVSEVKSEEEGEAPVAEASVEGEDEAAPATLPTGQKTYQTILYLPPGKYEYRFIVDNTETFDTIETVQNSSLKEGKCHIRVVEEDTGVTTEEKSTIFHIRWMRQGSNGVFELMEREHGLRYIPTKVDIGCCLRAEILSYVKGQYSFLFMDITSPVQPCIPQCTRLEIKGEAKENQLLLVEADYFGGEEGSSSLTWSRITPGGEEIRMDLQNPFEGFRVTKECIGCTIKATFVPVRNDWVPGEPKVVVTGRVVEGNPECQSIKIIGNLMEGCDFEVEVVYTGGREGRSRYQWLRKDPSGQYHPIEGQTNTVYHTTAADVGKSLAVEYTPVNDKGKEGEACRCVLDNLIAPASPEVRNISIYGRLRENEVLELRYEFFGGSPGQHMIRWFRRHPGMKHPTKIGVNNSTFLHLTSKEVGASIEVTMTPVRSDKVRGRAVLAKTASSVLPAVKEGNSTPSRRKGDSENNDGNPASSNDEGEKNGERDRNVSTEPLKNDYYNVSTPELSPNQMRDENEDDDDDVCEKL